VALSTVIAKLSPILGKDKSVEKLVPLVVRLLKDEVRVCRVGITKRYKDDVGLTTMLKIHPPPVSLAAPRSTP
jgi:hypothetical protein